MADLFAFGSATQGLDAPDRYGSTGDMKKTQYMMQLLGFPGDADTLKALIVAGEKGMEVESGVLDITQGMDKSDDYLDISPFGVMPALKEAKYQVAGDLAIISFIEGRGLGNRLPPRNAAVLAEQNYWIDIARENVAPHVQTIMREKVLNEMGPDARAADAAALQAAREALAAPLDALDGKLANNKFVVGDYSYADVHWTAYVHLLCVAAEQALIERRNNLNGWWGRIKQHKSFSGQNLVPYELLPSLEDIKAKRLKDVIITDY